MRMVDKLGAGAMLLHWLTGRESTLFFLELNVFKPAGRSCGEGGGIACGSGSVAARGKLSRMRTPPFVYRYGIQQDDRHKATADSFAGLETDRGQRLVYLHFSFND